MYFPIKLCSKKKFFISFSKKSELIKYLFAHIQYTAIPTDNATYDFPLA